MEWLEVTNARYLGAHQVLVTFNDGVTKKIDFEPIINQYPVFAKLRDEKIFSQLKVTDTIEWLDGAVDIAPEYIYEHGENVVLAA